MQWLTPMAGLIAGAVAVPALLLLYFLKLRRREVVVGSTLLWKRAVQDLQVNAPFQRLRKNLLLFLQLLAILAVLVALAGPVLNLQEGPGQRYVLLIDRSASMSAADVEGGRLAKAKELARATVASMRGQQAFRLTDQSDQAMVIAFDSQPKVLCNFTSDKAKLQAAIEEVSPGDGGSSLAEAVKVARAYAQPAGEEANDRSAEPDARLELYSDGKIVDLADVVVREKELGYHCVGDSGDNVGIVAMDARRSYEDPNEVTAFAALANAGEQSASCDVQLSLDGTVRALQTVHLPGRTAATKESPSRPGEASVSFTFSHGGAGVIEVRQLRRDSLTADDAAWTVLQPPKKLTVALVSPGSLPLTAALKAAPLAKLDVMTPAEFDALDAVKAEGYDVVVLDRHMPKELPRGRYLVFGAAPPDVPAEKNETGEFVMEWAARHPALEYVSLENLYAAKHYKLSLPRETRVLAEFSDGAAMALLHRKAGTLLLTSFEIEDTNWPWEPTFQMFCLNALDFLGAEAGTAQRTATKVGQSITVQGGPGVTDATVMGPGGLEARVQADSGGVFRFPGTSRVGLYTVSAGGQKDRFAVNLADAQESDIAPARQLTLAGEAVSAVSTGPRRQNREVWPWLAGLALALVCLEWVVYNSKVRI